MFIQHLKYNLVLLLVLITVITKAQQDIQLPGVVVEQNSKIKTGAVIYLQGASVNAPQSTPQVSDANGKFTLIFGDMPAGNVARLNVLKDGYEVVNSKLLQAAAITGRKTPLEIVMCKSGLLYQNQIVYYNIAVDASRDQYEKKISILEQGGKNKDALIAQLQKETDKQISSKEEAIKSLTEQYQLQLLQSESLANKLVTVNLDDETETYQKAFAAFQVKDIDKALSLLDSVNLEERLFTNTKKLQEEELQGTTSQQNVEKQKQQIKQDISQCMFKGRLHTLKYDYETATQSYLLAIKYDSSNTENLWEVASFFLNNKQDSLAKKMFDRLLTLAPASFDKANTLADIGNAYKNIGAYEEAEKYYPLSLKILKQLYEKNPAKFRIAVAKTTNAIGSLYYEWQYYAIAESYFNEADDIYSDYDDDSKHKPKMSDAESLVWYNIISNKCLLYYKYKNYDEALDYSYYNYADILPEDISTKNSELANNLEAQGLYNEGLIEFYSHKYAAAGNDFIPGIDLMRSLADKNPDKYAAELGNMLNTQGRICFELNAYDSAEQLYTQASKILKDATGKNPSDLFLTYLGNTLSNLGCLYDEMKDYAKGEKYFSEALDIQKQLIENNPSKSAADLANTLSGFGLLNYHRTNYTSAQKYYVEALENYKNLAKKSPEVYLDDLANMHYNYGRLYFALKKYDSAGFHLTQALIIQSEQVKKEKDRSFSQTSNTLAFYLSALLKTLNSIDGLYQQHAGNIKTNTAYIDSKKYMADLWEKNKLSLHDSIILLDHLGYFCNSIRVYSKAGEYYNNAIEKYLSMPKEDRETVYGFNIIDVLVDLAEVYRKELEITKDFSYRDKAIKTLARADQANNETHYYGTYDADKKKIHNLDSALKNSTGKNLNITSDFVEDMQKKLDNTLSDKSDTLYVIANLEKIINGIESRRKGNPDNQDINTILSKAYGNIAWFYIFRKQFSKTLESAQKGLALDTSQIWIYTNLAIGYLSQGKLDEAKKIYAKYKDYAFDDERSFQEAFLGDIHDLRQAGIIFPDMREAEDFLLH